MEKDERIFQIKVTLKSSKPKIWRRILIPAYKTFYELHQTVQAVMGWKNRHMHAFRGLSPITRADIVIQNKEYELQSDGVDEKKIKLNQYFKDPHNFIEYEYDFEDGWIHEILLEKIMGKDPSSVYPKCVAGSQACPPENCGGLGGYADLLDILADSSHPEYEEKKEWMESQGYDEFDPNVFDLSLVVL